MKKLIAYLTKHGILFKVCGVITAISLVIGAVVTGAGGFGAGFDPTLLTGDTSQLDGMPQYDHTIFGSSQQDTDSGLEMDQEAQEDYSVQDGEQKILDNTVSDGLQIGELGEDGSGTAGAVIGNDDSGIHISVPGGGNLPGNTGTGENGQGGTQGGGNQGGSTNSGTEEETDPDAGKYGVDYSNPENISSVYPSEAADESKGVYAVSLKVTKGSLLQHFYQGEAPRSAEMRDYITVSATMSDGTVRNNLQYMPSKALGGDYTVAWSDNPTNQQNSIGYPMVGDDYGKQKHTATLSYRGATCRLSYDIVHWQLLLTDFSEDFSQYGDAYFDDFTSELYEVGEKNEAKSPEESPVIDLSDDVFDMYNRIGIRTRLNNGVDPENITHYQYVNQTYSNPDDEYDTTAYCIEFFGGWSDVKGTDGQSTGSLYCMKRPSDAQIDRDGVYSVTMYPTWKKNSQKDEYIIVLNGEVGRIWNTELIGYHGTSSTLRIPEGVQTLDYNNLMYYSDWESNTKIKKLVLPASLTNFEYLDPFAGVVNYFPNLEEISIDANNQRYLDIDGILYNKAGTELCLVPSGKTSINKWSKYVNSIADYAFYGTHFNEVTLPETVTDFYEYSFLDARINTLKIQCPTGLRLADGVFDSDLTDDEGNPVLGVQNIVINSNNLNYIQMYQYLPQLFEYLDSSDLSRLGMNIVVPDSNNDMVYRSILMQLEKSIDAYSYNDNRAFSILSTPKKAQQKYSLNAEGSLLSKDGKTLVRISSLLTGIITLPDSIHTISAGAFLGSDEITAVKVPGSVEKIEERAFDGAKALQTLQILGSHVLTLPSYMFGDTIPAGLMLCINRETYDSYLKKQAEQLNQNYGTQTAQQILYPVDGERNTLLEDGSLYYDNLDGTYELVHANCALKGYFTPKAGTASVRYSLRKKLTMFIPPIKIQVYMVL